jgi:adenosylhomocysteine nucleosidase
MQQDPVIGLVMATMLEAKPFVSGLGLKEYETLPFNIFGNDSILLIISGIGKANAAMACTFFIQRNNLSVLCNMGAAGATDHELKLGECYQIEKVIEPDRPDLETGIPSEHIPDILEGLPCATLATQDKPVINAEEREKVARIARLVDMEGASVGQTCKRFEKPCHLFKFVSDTPDHDQSSDIRTNIALYRDAFYEFFLKSVLPRLEQHHSRHIKSA